MKPERKYTIVEEIPQRWPSRKAARELWVLLLDRMGEDQKLVIDLLALAVELGFSRQSLYKGLEQLEEVGWIKRVIPRSWAYLWVNPKFGHRHENHDRIEQLIKDYENHGTTTV